MPPFWLGVLSAPALSPLTWRSPSSPCLVGWAQPPALLVPVAQQWPQDWKRSVFIPISKTGNAKECSNYRTIELVSQASKIMLNILPARLQQYENRELLMFKLVLEKEEEAEMQLPTSAASRKKQESSRRTSISAFWTMQSH